MRSPGGKGFGGVRGEGVYTSVCTEPRNKTTVLLFFSLVAQTLTCPCSLAFSNAMVTHPPTPQGAVVVCIWADRRPLCKLSLFQNRGKRTRRVARGRLCAKAPHHNPPPKPEQTEGDRASERHPTYSKCFSPQPKKGPGRYKRMYRDGKPRWKGCPKPI